MRYESRLSEAPLLLFNPFSTVSFRILQTISLLEKWTAPNIERFYCFGVFGVIVRDIVVTREGAKSQGRAIHPTTVWHTHKRHNNFQRREKEGRPGEFERIYFSFFLIVNFTAYFTKTSSWFWSKWIIWRIVKEANKGFKANRSFSTNRHHGNR